jgi:hypothetical protein
MANLRRLLAPLPAVLVLLIAPRARAETLQAPIGGKPIPLGEGRVACTPPPAGWSVEADGHALRPPADAAVIGQSVELRVAPAADACGSSKTSVTLVATGPWPSIDAAGTLLAVDDARLELRGRGLRGVRVAVRGPSRTAEDTCLDPKTEGNAERCMLAVGRGLPADPTALSLAFTPAGGRTGADVSTFDAEGRRATAADFALPLSRLTIAAVVPGGAAANFAAGARHVALTHPEAVTSVECSPAQCDVAPDGVAVRGLAAAASSLAMRFRLLPRVWLARGDTLDPLPVASVPVLTCPISVVSGPPLRGIDDARVVLRLSGECAKEARSLRFRVGTAAADVLRVAADGDAAYVVLRAGRIGDDDEEVTVTAVRPEPDVSIVGVTHAATRSADPPHATLELAGHGTIDFIPTNQSASIRVSGAGERMRLVVLPVTGVYDVTSAGGAAAVRGVPSAGGFVSLRFAYRAEGLPASLGDTDLGFATEPVQRPVHAVNVPAPLGASILGAAPLIQMVCDVGRGKQITVRPGATVHVPFEARDGCRLIFRRERLTPEYGTQKLSLEVEVTKADGATRPEARLTQPIVLRPGGETRVAWLRGVAEPFDRLSVRLGHANDESHYVAGEEVPSGMPSAQWAVVMGTARARLYATTAIPTGLYRVSDRDHSGILTLSFGALGRLTWLDADGDEGVLGLEAGIMGVGLANDTSPAGRSLTQVAAVTGLSLGVPIANRASPTETSINIHAWLEFEPSRALGNGSGSPLGFVFGPSITIGNVGVNL